MIYYIAYNHKSREDGDREIDCKRVCTFLLIHILYYNSVVSVCVCEVISNRALPVLPLRLLLKHCVQQWRHSANRPCSMGFSWCLHLIDLHQHTPTIIRLCLLYLYLLSCRIFNIVICINYVIYLMWCDSLKHYLQHVLYIYITYRGTTISHRPLNP